MINKTLITAIIVIIISGLFYSVFSKNLETANDENISVKNIGVIIRSSGFCGIKTEKNNYWKIADNNSQIRENNYIKSSSTENSFVNINLKDGSKIVLNSAAEIKINNDRNIDLIYGEAYLEAAQTGKPFYVNDGYGITKISSANINFKKTNANIIITLIQGQADYKYGNTITKIITGKNCIVDKNDINFSVTDIAETLKWFERITKLKIKSVDKGVGELVSEIDGSGVNLSIIEHKVNVEIQGVIARTEVEEIFYNHTDRRLEGTFYFPLPAGATISDFSMWIGDKKVDGEIVEKFKARQIYESIVRQKRDPALLEWMDGNIFKMRIFPIDPRQPKKIKLIYTQIIQGPGDKYEFIYPLLSEQLKANPLKIFSITVAIDKNTIISKPYIISHNGNIIEKNGYYLFNFSAKDYKPENDFIMNYKLKTENHFSVFSHYREIAKGSDNNTKDGYFLLNYFPEISGSAAKKVSNNYIFLFDSSGSMKYQNFETGKKILETYLELLPDNTEFNIISGDAEIKYFSETSVYNAHTSRKAASEYINRINPYGGSNLLKLFKSASLFIKDNTEIIYIGDGIATLGITENKQLLNNITNSLNTNQCAISTITPGSSYNKIFLEQLTNAYNGLSAYISNSGNVIDTIEKIIQTKQKPLINRISYTIESDEISKAVPNIFSNTVSGNSVNLFGRFKNAGDYKITFNYFSGGKEYTKEFKFNLKKEIEKNSFIPRIWAVNYIDKLLDDIQICQDEKTEQIKNEIIKTSQEYSIMTPYTSFLVLETEKDYEEYGIRRRYKMKEWQLLNDGEKNIIDELSGDLKLNNFKNIYNNNRFNKNMSFPIDSIKREEKQQTNMKSTESFEKIYSDKSSNVNFLSKNIKEINELNFEPNGFYSRWKKPSMNEFSQKRERIAGDIISISGAAMFGAGEVFTINGSSMFGAPISNSYYSVKPGAFYHNNNQYIHLINDIFPFYNNYAGNYNDTETSQADLQILNDFCKPFTGGINIETKFYNKEKVSGENKYNIFFQRKCVQRNFN